MVCSSGESIGKAPGMEGGLLSSLSTPQVEDMELLWLLFWGATVLGALAAHSGFHCTADVCDISKFPLL